MRVSRRKSVPRLTRAVISLMLLVLAWTLIGWSRILWVEGDQSGFGVVLSHSPEVDSEWLGIFRESFSLPKRLVVNLHPALMPSQICTSSLLGTRLGEILISADVELKRLAQRYLLDELDFLPYEEGLKCIPRFWIELGSSRIEYFQDEKGLKVLRPKTRFRVKLEVKGGGELPREISKYLLEKVRERLEKEVNEGENFSEFREAIRTYLLARAVRTLSGSVPFPVSRRLKWVRRDFLDEYVRSYYLYGDDQEWTVGGVEILFKKDFLVKIPKRVWGKIRSSVAPFFVSKKRLLTSVVLGNYLLISSLSPFSLVGDVWSRVLVYEPPEKYLVRIQKSSPWMLRLEKDVVLSVLSIQRGKVFRPIDYEFYPPEARDKVKEVNQGLLALYSDLIRFLKEVKSGRITQDWLSVLVERCRSISKVLEGNLFLFPVPSPQSKWRIVFLIYRVEGRVVLEGEGGKRGTALMVRSVLDRRFPAIGFNMSKIKNYVFVDLDRIESLSEKAKVEIGGREYTVYPVCRKENLIIETAIHELTHKFYQDYIDRLKDPQAKAKASIFQEVYAFKAQFLLGRYPDRALLIPWGLHFWRRPYESLAFAYIVKDLLNLGLLGKTVKEVRKAILPKWHRELRLVGIPLLESARDYRPEPGLKYDPDEAILEHPTVVLFHGLLKELDWEIEKLERGRCDLNDLPMLKMILFGGNWDLLEKVMLNLGYVQDEEKRVFKPRWDETYGYTYTQMYLMFWARVRWLMFSAWRYLMLKEGLGVRFLRSSLRDVVPVLARGSRGGEEGKEYIEAVRKVRAVSLPLLKTLRTDLDRLLKDALSTDKERKKKGIDVLEGILFRFLPRENSSYGPGFRGSMDNVLANSNVREAFFGIDALYIPRDVSTHSIYPESNYFPQGIPLLAYLSPDYIDRGHVGLVSLQVYGDSWESVAHEIVELLLWLKFAREVLALDEREILIQAKEKRESFVTGRNYVGFLRFWIENDPSAALEVGEFFHAVALGVQKRVERGEKVYDLTSAWQLAEEVLEEQKAQVDIRFKAWITDKNLVRRTNLIRNLFVLARAVEGSVLSPTSWQEDDLLYDLKDLISLRPKPDTSSSKVNVEEVLDSLLESEDLEEGHRALIQGALSRLREIEQEGSFLPEEVYLFGVLLLIQTNSFPVLDSSLRNEILYGLHFVLSETVLDESRVASLLTKVGLVEKRSVEEEKGVGGISIDGFGS